MTQATTLRRTYTERRNYDDSQSSDNSLRISFASSSTSRASESEKNTHASEEEFIENIVKNTTNTEVGKPKKKSRSEKSTKNTTGSSSPLSEGDKEIIEFFKKLKNHSDPKKTKKDLVEEFIRSNATEAFMWKMNQISEEEKVRLTSSILKKWGSFFGSGGVSQNTSFLPASELALHTKYPWLFPFVAAFLSEVFSDKAAAQIRRTTFVTNDLKHLCRKQDLIAKAVGDMIRQFSCLKPEAKHKSNNPAHKGERFTAWDALWKDSDYFLKISASNWLNRGLPFICFTGTNLVRDYLLQGMLKGAPWWQTLLLRWGSGVMAGGSTALLNQLITSHRKDAIEVPGYSTSYIHAKETYLHSVRLDIRDRLNEIENLTDPALQMKLRNLLLDLDKKIQREIGVAGLKKSSWCAIPGEIKASTHRSRPEDSIDPEAPGTRAQSIHSAIGKFFALIHFTYMLDQSIRSESENGTDSFSANSVLNLMVLPFALIFTGYMFKDDLQIISKIFGEVTEAVRDVTTGRAAYQERTATPLNEVATTMPEQINTNDGKDDENDADNRVAGGPKVKFADELSIEILTDREREARDRKREREKKEEASTTASYANKKPAKMSGSADSESDDDSSKDDSKSARSSDKVTGSSSSSSQSASRSSTKTYGADDSSSSQESPTPKRKRQS